MTQNQTIEQLAEGYYPWPDGLDLPASIVVGATAWEVSTSDPEMYYDGWEITYRSSPHVTLTMRNGASVLIVLRSPGSAFYPAQEIIDGKWSEYIDRADELSMRQVIDVAYSALAAEIVHRREHPLTEVNFNDEATLARIALAIASASGEIVEEKSIDRLVADYTKHATAVADALRQNPIADAE